MTGPATARSTQPGWVAPVVAATLFAMAVGVWLSTRRADEASVPRVDADGSSYVDPQSCRPCHTEIWDSYAETGMGRSFSRVQDLEADERLVQPTPFFHEASDRYYQVVERDGRAYLKRWQDGFSGRPANVREERIDFVMGSGNHARSFLRQEPDGRLFEAPLGWYADGGGTWAMSPGYDRPNHDGFERVVGFDCMFCHNGYPELPPGADRVGEPPRYTGRIPSGIDCQRCHGPGEEHVAAASSGVGDTEAIRATIVNPARLTQERQLDVCFQCHLETTSRPLPQVVHRYDRSYFSFRPGEALSGYALHFDHAAGAGWDDKFEINHAAYQLRRSACFTRSPGLMTCTTCHDPHLTARGEEAVAQYRTACLGCHTGEAGPPADGVHGPNADCASCHMPKRRTHDVVHAVMTDHRIMRRPPADPLAPLAERSLLSEVGYRGEVTPYYPDAAHVTAGDEIYVAAAQVMQASNLEAGIERLARAIDHLAPEEAEPYFELGDAYLKAGRPVDAVARFEEALRRRPDFALARRRLGEALAAAGDDARAEQELMRAGETVEGAAALRELGLLQARQGRFAEAVETSRAALARDPKAAAVHNTLGGALASLGRTAEAEASYREALRLDPDLFEAEYNLGNLLAAGERWDEAELHWARVVARDASNTAARYNYAISRLSRGDARDARNHLAEIVRVDPEHHAAHLLLGELLAASGQTAEARRHFEKAAEAADLETRQAALDALR